MARRGRKLAGIHAKHGYKPQKSRQRNGKYNIQTNLGEMSYKNIVSMSIKRNISVSAMLEMLTEFALLEMEDQGEIVLNKFKDQHSTLISDSRKLISQIDSILEKK